MRLYRLVGRHEKGGVVVFADISGQGKRPVRVRIGYLADRDGIEQKVQEIRDSVNLREAVRVRGGM